MKVFQINTVSNWGATGRIVEGIGEKILECGGKGFIAYGRHNNESLLQTIKIGTNTDIYIHVLQTRLFDKHGLASKSATLRLIRQIVDIGPDVIHLHNIHGYYLNYKVLFRFLSKIDIPVVWTLHDCWPFTGHCSYYSFIKCERWKNECFDCPQKRNYPASILFDRSRSNYWDKRKEFTSVRRMVLVPVSNWLAGELSSSFLKDISIQVIHNGIDIDVFSPFNSVKAEHKLNNKFVIIGVANNWVARKGLGEFLKLSKMLDEDEIIVLVGLSANQAKNLPGNIIGFCRVGNTGQLANLYSSADVFFNPTFEDNIPTTNLEALSCGIPVITYHTGGSTEAIDDHTGYVVEQGNIQDALWAIREVKRKGKSHFLPLCRERAVRFFNKYERYDDYIKLYKKMLNS